jgi:hypothetical protein
MENQWENLCESQFVKEFGKPYGEIFFYSCPKPVFSKQNAYSGNYNVQGYLNTDWFKFSQNVNIAATSRGGSKFTIVNKNINAFGSYQGAPGGWGQPPRNKFN